MNRTKKSVDNQPFYRVPKKLMGAGCSPGAAMVYAYLEQHQRLWGRNDTVYKLESLTEAVNLGKRPLLGALDELVNLGVLQKTRWLYGYKLPVLTIEEFENWDSESAKCAEYKAQNALSKSSKMRFLKSAECAEYKEQNALFSSAKCAFYNEQNALFGISDDSTQVQNSDGVAKSPLQKYKNKLKKKEKEEIKEPVLNTHTITNKLEGENGKTDADSDQSEQNSPVIANSQDSPNPLEPFEPVPADRPMPPVVNGRIMAAYGSSPGPESRQRRTMPAGHPGVSLTKEQQILAVKVFDVLALQVPRYFTEQQAEAPEFVEKCLQKVLELKNRGTGFTLQTLAKYVSDLWDNGTYPESYQRLMEIQSEAKEISRKKLEKNAPATSGEIIF